MARLRTPPFWWYEDIPITEYRYYLGAIQINKIYLGTIELPMSYLGGIALQP